MSKTLVSLCYDGGRANHFSTVVPLLRAHGFKATFFIDPPHVLNHISAWRSLAAEGHEIGNGTLLASALPDGTLPAFTSELILDEIEEARRALTEVFETPDQCLALPYGEDRCADGPYVARARRICALVRVGEHGVNSLPVLDFSRIISIPCDGLKNAQITALLEESQNSWVVLVFNTVSARRQTELLEFLAENRDRFAVETVTAASQMLRSLPASKVHLS